jgi:hypothetical protein
MGQLENPTTKDIRKNIQNVRMSEIHRAISDSNMITRDSNYGNNKTQGTEVKLLFSTSGLNTEEMSLLRDSAPNMSYASGKVSCAWKLSRRFAEENKNNLHQMMMNRMGKEVNALYGLRLEKLNEVASAFQSGSLSCRTGTDGASLWSKIATSMGLEKPRHETSLGMG